MPFGKLFPGQVVPEHLLLELLGVDDGVAVAFWCRAVSTYIAWCYELDDRQIGGSNRHCVGVPVKQGAPAPFFAGMLPARIHADSKGARCGTCTYVTGRANSTQVLLQISIIE